MTGEGGAVAPVTRRPPRPDLQERVVPKQSPRKDLVDPAEFLRKLRPRVLAVLRATLTEDDEAIILEIKRLRSLTSTHVPSALPIIGRFEVGDCVRNMAVLLSREGLNQAYGRKSAKVQGYRVDEKAYQGQVEFCRELLLDLDKALAALEAKPIGLADESHSDNVSESQPDPPTGDTPEDAENPGMWEKGLTGTAPVKVSESEEKLGVNTSKFRRLRYTVNKDLGRVPLRWRRTLAGFILCVEDLRDLGYRDEQIAKLVNPTVQTKSTK